MAQSPGYGAIWSVESKSKIERHGSTSEYICDRPGVAMLARVWPPPVSTWSSLHLTTLANITHRDPDILSGSLVFVGTRVPVRSLFDYLEGGESIDEFLHQFPSVKREFAIAVLDAAYETVAADANIA
jgi:uncharacterized protein (DUF433 family)